MIFPTKEGDWTLTEGKIEEWKESYSTKDVDNEIVKARQWLRDNPERQKTKRGMTKYLGGWIARSPDSFTPATAKPIVEKERMWFSQCGDWLMQATLFEIKGNKNLMSRLDNPEFRAWAERVNPLVKEA